MIVGLFTYTTGCGVPVVRQYRIPLRFHAEHAARHVAPRLGGPKTATMDGRFQGGKPCVRPAAVHEDGRDGLQKA